MSEKIRIAGAQIPVSRDVSKNIHTIKNAIDWAAENFVDFLVTPEGSLSGYIPEWDFNEVKLALTEIEQYSKSKHVGLCLGTLWKEPTKFGEVARNQIRFYKNGMLFGTTNKSYTIEHDHVMPHDIKKDSISIFPLTNKNGTGINAVGLICNDMWGNNWYGGPNIMKIAMETRRVGIAIHSTNGTRGNDLDEIMNQWHDVHLKLLSKASSIPIVTVDNSIHMEGDDYNGRTSSESGVIIEGKWVTSVPRVGTQYFYYDFDI